MSESNYLTNQMLKPAAVRVSVNLLWLSLILSIATAFFTTRPTDLTSLLASPVTLFALFIVLTLIALLIIQISAGKNWARLTLLALFSFGLWNMISSPELDPSNLVSDYILKAIQILIQGTASFLLFTRASSLWFRS